VHASPLYHATYVEEARQQVLCHLALQQLDYRLRPDALAAVRAARHYEVHDENPDNVIAFLNQYGRARETATHSASGWLSCRTIAEAIDLLHLHEAVKRIADNYYLSIATKMPQEENEQQLKLPQLELLRIYRGIYRFQLYCNMFVKHKPDGRECFRTSRRIAPPSSYFLPAFPPWEVQEIAGMWQYINRRWASILREVSDIYFPKHVSRGGPDDDSELEETFTYLRMARHAASDGNYLLDPRLRMTSSIPNRL
jgi:hypothetical protein